YGNARPNYVWQHLRQYFGLSDPHNLSVTALNTAMGSVQVNSVAVAQESWSGQYFAEVPITVTAVPKAGYRFSHWEGDISSADRTLSVSLVEDMNLTPVFVAE